VPAEREVIVLLSCEAREVVHDDEVDRPIVFAALLQDILQFAAFGRLGGAAGVM
jgi:hypothetical protein